MDGNASAQVLVDLAIDFGSTNTVMAWRIFDVQANGSKVRSIFTAPDANEDGISIKRIPSVMIFKDENPNNAVVPQDLYGEDARNAIRMSNISPKVCDNFKQYLYTCPPDSDDYKHGVDLTTKFFEHLRQEYMSLIYNRMPSDTTVAVNLYLSTPVRAEITHRSLMRRIAEKAGFTSEIGIREIITDCDEARCVVQYAMDHKKDSIQELLSLIVQKEAIVLFVDVGGSTTDMNLVRLSVSPEGKITLNPFSCWPDSDVKYPLGGCLIDEAIRDYLIQEGFADEKYARNQWEHRDGKDRFRVFKEQNNLSLSQGECVEKLGMLRNVCYDSDDEDFEPRKYKNSPRRINDTIFRDEICARYIAEMRDALKAIFTNQRSENGKPPIRPEDVDGILLSGAGSLLYFVRDIFLEDGMGFKKIQQNRSQLYTWPDPSLCCAMGALAKSQTEYLSYARDNYYVRFDIFNPTDRNELFFSKSFPLVKKHQLLPWSVGGEESFSYSSTGDVMDLNLILGLSLYRVDSSGEAIPVGEPVCCNVDGKPIFGFLFSPFGPFGLAGFVTREFVRHLIKFKADAKISYCCTLSRSNQVKFQLKITGSRHNMGEKEFEVTL